MAARGVPALKARPSGCCAHLEAILRAIVRSEPSALRQLS